MSKPTPNQKYPADNDILHPLKIELVLAKVFSFLKPQDLKNCRLVCKLWKDEASDDLGSQTYLAIHKLQNRIRTGAMPLIHPCLLQQIKIQMEVVTWAQPAPYSCLVPFLTNHRGQVEWIRIIGASYFLHPLKTILESVDFPNLTKISLEEEYWYNRNPAPVPAQCLNPTLDVSLSRIKILEILISDYGGRRTNVANFSTFQLLINQCQNLEGLKTTWYFYPDLCRCTKLKSLHWVGPLSEKNRDYRQRRWFHTWTLSIPKLIEIEMLEPIKDILENLTIGSTLKQKFHARRSDPERFYLYPCMPKLTKLSVSDIILFCIHEDSFIQSRLPALKILTLKSNQVIEFPIPIKPLLLKWGRGQSKVNAETLSLNQFPIGEVQSISDVTTNFPNLKKLTLGITEKPATGGSTSTTSRNAQLLKNTLNAISQELPSLTELTIHIEFGCTLAELMDGICAEGFKGEDLKLKVVIPKSDDFMNVEDNGCDNFKQAFTLYHKGLTLEGLRWKMTLGKRCVISFENEVFRLFWNKIRPPFHG